MQPTSPVRAHNNTIAAFAATLLGGVLVFGPLHASQAAESPIPHKTGKSAAAAKPSPSKAQSADDVDSVTCKPTLASDLAGFSLKTRAARITDQETVEALVRPLRQMSAARGATLGEVEVLGWGSDGMDKPLADTKASAIMGEVKSALEKAGYTYSLPTAGRKTGDTTVTLVTAGNEAGGDRLVGFWIRTDHALLLAWGRVLPAGSEGASPVAAASADPALVSLRH